MNWYQIAKAWTQFVAEVVRPGSSAPEAITKCEDSNRTAPTRRDVYDETRMMTYAPDNHDVRSESSLHLSS